MAEKWEFDAPQYLDFARLSSGEEKECKIEVEDYFNYDHERGNIPVSYQGVECSHEGAAWVDEKEEEEMGCEENKENEGGVGGNKNIGNVAINEEVSVGVKMTRRDGIVYLGEVSNCGNAVADGGGKRGSKDEEETIDEEVIGARGVADNKGDINQGANVSIYNQGVSNTGVNEAKYKCSETPLSKVLAYNKPINTCIENNSFNSGSDTLINSNKGVENVNQGVETINTGGNNINNGGSINLGLKDYDVEEGSCQEDDEDTDDMYTDDTDDNEDGGSDGDDNKDRGDGGDDDRGGDDDVFDGERTRGGSVGAADGCRNEEITNLERSFNNEALDKIESPSQMHGRFMAVMADVKRLSMSVDRGKALRQLQEQPLNPVKNGFHRNHILFGGRVEKELIKGIEKEVQEKKQQAYHGLLPHRGQVFRVNNAVKITQVKPFSFEARMKEAMTKKEEFIKRAHQEQKAEFSMFKAQPLPSIYFKNLPSYQSSHHTSTQSFQKCNLIRVSNPVLSNQKSSRVLKPTKMSSKNVLNFRQSYTNHSKLSNPPQPATKSSNHNSLIPKPSTKMCPFVLQTSLRASQKEQNNVQQQNKPQQQHRRQNQLNNQQQQNQQQQNDQQQNKQQQQNTQHYQKLQQHIEQLLQLQLKKRPTKNLGISKQLNSFSSKDSGMNARQPIKSRHIPSTATTTNAANTNTATNTTSTTSATTNTNNTSAANTTSATTNNTTAATSTTDTSNNNN